MAGASTACKVGSDVGMCSGTRKCTESGLSLCDAPSPSAEICNGKDDDCNGQTDEAGAGNCTLFYGDADDDGFGGGAGACLCAADLAHAHEKGADCDDQDAAVHPGAAESCNGVDDNCNGKTDEPGAAGCTPFYADADADSFGAGAASCQCAADLAFSATASGDCNDSAAGIHPDATEICDGADNNCNGLTDEAGASCTFFYADVDGDGYGAGDGVCLCAADKTHVTAKSGDCDDADETVHPKAAESCNGVDDNCDGATDEAGAADCGKFYADADGDKFGGGAPACLCAADVTYTTAKGGDCDDANAAIHPKADETCNGQDDDCDGVTDGAGSEGCVSYFADGDSDGFGGTGLAPKCLCAASGNYVALVAGDCNDGDAKIFPGTTESCNGVDDNCDSVTDPVNSAGCQTWYVDADADGYGGAGTQCACTKDGNYSTLLAGDCDDGKPGVHPNAAEICNGYDDNCDGSIDEGASGGATYYADSDGDGYGNAGAAVVACAQPVGYVSDHTDCDDAHANVNPGAAEIACNNVDDDCNGATVDGTGSKTYYQDVDGDGYGDPGSTVVACAQPAGYVNNSGDCNDYQVAINKAAQEVACNTVDDNCNGVTDEGSATTAYYVDGDGDGYGTGAAVQSCAAMGGYVTKKGDCNDNNPNINPGKAEACNALDDNCDGQTDEGQATTYYRDEDGDSFGTPSDMKTQCTKPAGYVTNNWDCNDKSSAVKPVVVPFFGFNISSITDESACNNTDDDCDGQTDEGAKTTWYYDGDGDGFGTSSNSQKTCVAPSKYVQEGSDCNDTDNTMHIGGTEITCDGKDNDCVGGDSCGTTCVAATEYNFDAGAQGWSLGSGWVISDYQTTTNALLFGSKSGGFSKASGGSTSSVNWYVPGGAQNLKMTIYFGNVTDYNNGYYDSGATMTFNLNGTTKVVGPYGYTDTKYTVTIPVNSAWWNTTVPFSITVKTTTSSSDSYGGFAIDDIQVSCP